MFGFFIVSGEMLMNMKKVDEVGYPNLKVSLLMVGF